MDAQTERRPYTRGRALFDGFAALDILAFAAAEARIFPGTGPGFKIYSLVLLGILVTLWLALRRHEYPVWAVLVLQLSLLGHLAGRFVLIDGLPLYRAEFLGMPGDKVVHAFNSLAVAAFVTVLFRRLELVLRGWEGFIVVMVVCGAGALVEIIEYGSVLLLPSTHVGSYANNMQDLIANLFGALLGWLAVRFALARTS